MLPWPILVVGGGILAWLILAPSAPWSPPPQSAPALPPSTPAPPQSGDGGVPPFIPSDVSQPISGSEPLALGGLQGPNPGLLTPYPGPMPPISGGVPLPVAPSMRRAPFTYPPFNPALVHGLGTYKPRKVVPLAQGTRQIVRRSA